MSIDLAGKSAVAASGATSAFSGWLAILTNDLPLAVFGVPFAVLFAGFAGAVLALGMMPHMPRWKAFFAVTLGTVSAAWLVLPVTEALGWKPYPGYAFVLGLFAHGLITLAFQKGPEILERRFGGGTGGTR